MDSYLYRTHAMCYSLVLVTEKESRELKGIVFYADGKKVIQLSGWFNRKDIKHQNTSKLKLGKVVRKNKEDLTLNIPYFIPKKREYYESSDNPLYAILYLPFNPKEWKVKKNGYKHVFPKEIVYDDLWVSKKWDCEYRKESKRVPRKGNVYFLDKVEKISKMIGNDMNEYSAIKNKTRIKKLMKQILEGCL